MLSFSRTSKNNSMISVLSFAVWMVVVCMTSLPLSRTSIVVSSFQPTTTITTTISNPLSFTRAVKFTPSSHSSTALNVFGTKKSKKMTAEEMEKYWQGEWVCKDCGYIYNRAECAGMFFEEQGPGFRCPQCSGPRRRYAKKVGDRVGTTLDGGDAPILIFSFGGVILTIAFGIWAVNNL